MKKKFVTISRLALLIIMLFMLTGCQNEREKNQEAYRQNGINCMENGDYETAIESFQKALDLANGKVGDIEIDICFYKAQAQYLSGDYEAAFETYNALITYNQNAEAYYLRGNLHFMIGERDAALNDYATAVTKDRKNYELYIGIYESMAKYDMELEGQYYLNEALNIKGKKAYDNMQKGRISFLLGEEDRAIELLTKAVEAGEKEADFYLAEVYEANGDVTKAEACFKSYLDSGIADSVDLYEMGNRQMEKGNYEQAIFYFSSGLELKEVPNKQVLLKSLVFAYEKNGDFSEAKKQLESYIELYPSDEAAKREMTFLKTR